MPTTEKRIEMSYCVKVRRNTYIAGERWDFVWDLVEILEIEQLWRQGKSLEYIAEWIGRSQTDVFLLLLDRAEQGYVDARVGGVFGNG